MSEYHVPAYKMIRYWLWHRWFGHGVREHWARWPTGHCRRCYHEYKWDT